MITDASGLFPTIVFDATDTWDSVLKHATPELDQRGLARLRAVLGLDCRCVVIERQYIDKDYRDTFSHFHSKRFATPSSRCLRLHFFSAAVDEAKIVKDGAAVEDLYLGYSVIRPTKPNCVGRSLLSHRVRPNKTAHLAYCPEEVHLLGTRIRVSGFPFISQDADATVCAESALWMLLRYYSTKYPWYSEILPFQITNLATHHAVGHRVYNIAQKVQVIVEHFKAHVMGLLGGHAKAMVVTSSRKEAVRYKLCFDKYIAEKGYAKLYGMVAFSGEVEFSEKDPNSAGIIGQKFTEITMNPCLKGRDLRKAFDSGDYQVMIVANKFQTGFDQPKLCAMYVDKKLGGVECVQTLSRLNRVYPGKADTGTFVLDFFNEPEDILAAFKPYYQTATLDDVSDPNLIFDLNEKLRASGIFQWTEVEQFCTAFFQKSKSNAALANICKPAVQRWQIRYKAAMLAYQQTRELLERTKQTGDAVLIANAENSFKAAKKEKDALEIFKKDLGTFVRFYEFMSQIVDYDDPSLEKLSLYARNLSPLLREQLLDEDDIDLNHIVLSHYRLSKIRQQDLLLNEDQGPYGLKPGEGLGTAKARDPKEEFLSQIIARLNELFITDHLTENDLVNYAYTVRDKVRENEIVMKQLANNSDEQALLGDFPKAVDDAILDSSDAHENQKLQLLADPKKAAAFAKLVFDLLKAAS